MYIGYINECQVINEKQAAAAVRTFRQRGWLMQMAKQVDALGGDKDLILKAANPLWLFNLRFRPDNFRAIEPYERAPAGDPIYRPRRYTFMEVQNRDSRKSSHRSRGTQEEKSTVRRTRVATPATEVDPVHNRLQNHLFRLLRKRYGKIVSMEEDYVDIKVNSRTWSALVEVKSDPEARLAIRKAIGQLLEYAYYPSRNTGRRPRLIVAGPGKPAREAEEYLAYLRKRFGLAVDYLPVDLSMTQVTLP